MGGVQVIFQPGGVAAPITYVQQHPDQLPGAV